MKFSLGIFYISYLIATVHSNTNWKLMTDAEYNQRVKDTRRAVSDRTSTEAEIKAAQDGMEVALDNDEEARKAFDADQAAKSRETSKLPKPPGARKP